MVKDVTTAGEKPAINLAGSEPAHSIRRDSEKHRANHIPIVHKTKHDPEWDGSDVDFSHIDTKKVLRKMDIRLIPNLALLYLLSFLDRGNIGNAKIQGLTEDLHMTGRQYNWCLTVFFFTYCESCDQERFYKDLDPNANDDDQVHLNHQAILSSNAFVLPFGYPRSWWLGGSS
jgi:hypothetical protein